MMVTRPYLLHAFSPLHAGTGQAVEIIDLPIARMRSTGIPFVPGSSIKGVLRDARQRPIQDPEKMNREDPRQQELFAVFGPDTEHAAEHSGALVVSDARLLALPVRSFHGTFAWATSPLLLGLARRDLLDLANVAEVPALPRQPALESVLVADLKTSKNIFKQRVYLEDLDLAANADAVVQQWANLLAPRVSSEDQDSFAGRLVVVNDELMTFLWETATQVDTRIRMDPATRTVATGALWTEESLPPETLLIGLLAAHDSLNTKSRQTAAQILDYALNAPQVLQFGGKATVGRGRCRMTSLIAAVGGGR